MPSERAATDYLLSKGITRNLAGFDYLRQIALMCDGDIEIARCTMQLCVETAKAVSSTRLRVERAIRHAITRNGTKIKVSVFIVDMVDELRLGGTECEAREEADSRAKENNFRIQSMRAGPELEKLAGC